MLHFGLHLHLHLLLLLHLHLHIYLYYHCHRTFVLSFGCIMLAYFQVFHATRSHFVPILVAQSEQLHQQTTTVSTEWQMLHSVPFGLQFIYEPVVFMNILCGAFGAPGSFGGTYTSFWLPRRT